MENEIQIENKGPEPRLRDYRTREDFERALAEWKPRTVTHPGPGGKGRIRRSESSGV